MKFLSAIVGRVTGASWIGTAFRVLPWIGCAALGIMLAFKDAKIETLDARLDGSQKQTIITGQISQIEGLKAENQAKGVQLQFAAASYQLGTKIVAGVFSQSHSIADNYVRPPNVAPDFDALAAPVLCDAADRMRRGFAQLARMRASDNREARLSGVRYTGRTAETVWSELTCPMTQGQFADAVFRLADDFNKNVLVIDGIDAIASDYETKTKELNKR